MTFSSVIKDELCRVEAPNACCARAELAAIYCLNAAGGAPYGRIATENAAFARRIYNLARKFFTASPEVTVQKNKKLKKNMSYGILLGESADLAAFAGIPHLRRLIKKKCCKKAALRGAFLAGGSIADPEKFYHLEIYCKNQELANYISGLMAEYDLNSKIMERSEYQVVYVKDSDKIVDFLNLTGAHRALMSYENTRILKDMRNNVNRVVNFENANLEKTVNASLRQIINIYYIRDTVGYDALPENLREIAILREANKEIGLEELGQLLKPPLGKSGVNHRLRKLNLIAEDLRRKTSGVNRA